MPPSFRPLAISVGDPAGIGPDVAVTAAASIVDQERCVLFGDAEVLGRRFDELGVTHERADCAPEDLQLGTVGLVHAATWTRKMVDAHAPTAAGGEAQLAAFVAAWSAVREGHARALVTAPVNKEAITLSGTHFVGHTEFLARSVGLQDDDVTMMFLGPNLSVALVTTHCSIRDVPDAITEARVLRTVSHLAEALVLRHPGAERVRIVVTGLNPHAGEGGLFGVEEREVIAPALCRWPAVRPLGTEHVSVEGPIPAEAAFRHAGSPLVIGIVAMMHDQATIACKLQDWGRSVNVTWGLPFVRTSVDHGVAYDAARRGLAEDSGMRAALAMAQRLTVSSRA